MVAKASGADLHSGSVNSRTVFAARGCGIAHFHWNTKCYAGNIMIRPPSCNHIRQFVRYAPMDLGVLLPEQLQRDPDAPELAMDPPAVGRIRSRSGAARGNSRASSAASSSSAGNGPGHIQKLELGLRHLSLENFELLALGPLGFLAQTPDAFTCLFELREELASLLDERRDLLLSLRHGFRCRAAFL